MHPKVVHYVHPKVVHYVHPKVVPLLGYPFRGTTFGVPFVGYPFGVPLLEGVPQSVKSHDPKGYPREMDSEYEISQLS